MPDVKKPTPDTARTLHRKAVPDEVSYGRNGWKLELFRDGTDAMREKEYLHYIHLTPAERVGRAEEIRRFVYGKRYATSRPQGPIEVLKCPWC